MTIAAAGGQATASKCTSDLVKDKVVKCKLLLRDITSKTSNVGVLESGAGFFWNLFAFLQRIRR